MRMLKGIPVLAPAIGAAIAVAAASLPADTIPLSSSGTSYAVLTSPTLRLSGVAGQAVAGTCSSGTTVLTSGFMASPLLLARLVNHAPIITSPDSVVVTKSSPFLYLAKAVDPDSTRPQFLFRMLPSWLSAGNEVVQGTVPASPGADSFRVVATDGAGAYDSIVVHITIRDRNEKPIISSARRDTAVEGERYTYRLTAVDPNNDKITFSVFDLPDSLRWNAEANTIEGVIAEAENSQTKFIRMRADDGELYDEQILVLYIERVNNPPVITSAASVTVAEHVRLRYVPAARDPERAAISFSYDPFLPSWMRVFGDTLEGTAPEGARDTVFTVYASDGVLKDTLTVNVQVIPVDDPPKFTCKPVVIGDRLPPGQRIRYVVTAMDPEGAPVAIRIENPASWLTVSGDTVSGDITPASPDSSTFVAIATETTGLWQSDTMVVVVVIQQQNYPPQITSPTTVTAVPGRYFVYRATASDPNNNKVLLRFENLGQIPWLKTDADSVYGTAPATFVPTYFVVFASDYRDSVRVTVFINRDTSNSPPRIISRPDTLARVGVVYRYQVKAMDLDSATDRIRYALLSRPAGMTISTDSGTIVWTPTDSQAGVDTVVIRAYDTRQAADTQAYVLTVAHPYLAVTRRSPDSSASVQPLSARSVTVVFNTPMLDSTALAAGAITLFGTRSGPIAYSLSHRDSVLTIRLNDVPAGSDTITVYLSGSVRTVYGQTFSRGEYQWTFRTGLLGDYNRDDSLTEKDLPSLAQYWRSRTASGSVVALPELGPAVGVAPYLTVRPDSVYDFEDVAVFVQMWRWYARAVASGLLKSRGTVDPTAALLGRREADPAVARLVMAKSVGRAGEGERIVRLACSVRDVRDMVALRLRVLYPADRLSLMGDAPEATFPTAAASEVLQLPHTDDGMVDVAAVLLSAERASVTGSGEVLSISLRGDLRRGDEFAVAYDLLSADGTVIESGLARTAITSEDLPDEQDAVEAPSNVAGKLLAAPNPFTPAPEPVQFVAVDRPNILAKVAAEGNGCALQLTLPRPPARGAMVWVVIRDCSNGQVVAYTPKAEVAPAAAGCSPQTLTVYWDGRNRDGRAVVEGVYAVRFYVADAEGKLVYSTRVGVQRR